MEKVLISTVNRLGQSLADLIGFIEDCRSAGVSQYAHEQNLDTAASNGLSLFDFNNILVHYLRQSRRDRLLRGQSAARILNVRFGRPPLSVTETVKAKRELIAGKGVREVARSVGISAASVSRLKNSMGIAAT